MKSLFLSAYALPFLLSTAFASETHHSHHQHTPPPIGVSGGHLHPKGEWMISYQYDRNSTDGLKSGHNDVSSHDILKTYGEAPTDMTMDMHMAEAMVGVTDKLSLMAMAHYMDMDMTHESHGNHGAHGHAITGFGDTEISALYGVYRSDADAEVQHRVHLHGGLSLPTGETDKTFVNHHAKTYPLPYHMQFGSGTYDPIVGLTYTGGAEALSWGAQTLNTIRTGKNDEGYRLGNHYMLTGWVAQNLTDYANLSFRVKGEAWSDVSGRNASLPLKTIVGANPDMLAGERVMAYVGVNLWADESMGILQGNQIGVEVGLPAYERYDGAQPASEYQFTVGLKKVF
jgi:hypothetical protein